MTDVAAYIAFGINLGETGDKDSKAPWGYNKEYREFKDYICRDMENPSVPCRGEFVTAWEKHWDRIKARMESIPVSEILLGSTEYPTSMLVIKASIMTLPENKCAMYLNSKNAPYLMVGLEHDYGDWEKMLKVFCETHNIPYVKPRWFFGTLYCI